MHEKKDQEIEKVGKAVEVALRRPLAKLKEVCIKPRITKEALSNRELKAGDRIIHYGVSCIIKNQ